MSIREQEEDKKFKKQLQNPLKPINDTKASPEMTDYLNKLNNGTLKSKETKEREAKEKSEDEENKKYTLFCPSCRRPTLKPTPQRMYSCGLCGLVTNTPLRMAVTPEEQKEIDEKEKKEE